MEAAAFQNAGGVGKRTEHASGPRQAHPGGAPDWYGEKYGALGIYAAGAQNACRRRGVLAVAGERYISLSRPDAAAVRGAGVRAGRAGVRRWQHAGSEALPAAGAASGGGPDRPDGRGRAESQQF